MKSHRKAWPRFYGRWVAIMVACLLEASCVSQAQLERTKEISNGLSCDMSREDVYAYARSNHVQMFCEPSLSQENCALVTERNLVEYQVVLYFDRMGHLKSSEVSFETHGAWISGQKFERHGYCN